MKKTLFNIVHDTLEENVVSRCSDKVLIFIVMSKLGYYTFSDACRKDAPSTESIRRCRQKIQADEENLRAPREVEEQRLYEEMKYVDFAKYNTLEEI